MPLECQMEAKGSVSGRCQFCNAQLSLVKPNGRDEKVTDGSTGIVESIFSIFDRECLPSDAHAPSTSGSSSGSGAKKDVEVGSDDDSFVLLDSPREASPISSWSVRDVAVMNKVLNMCSRVTGIQQPLCADCSNDLYTELQQGIEEMKSSKEAYEALYTKLSERVDDGDGRVDDDGEEEAQLAQEVVVWECVLLCVFLMIRLHAEWLTRMILLFIVENPVVMRRMSLN